MNSFKNCSGAPYGGTSLRNYLSQPCLSIVAFSLLCLSLPGCGSSKEQKEKLEVLAAMGDSVSHYFPGITTDTLHGITHNFIRNAGIKCKVKDVLAGTREVEDLAASYGGYITKSELSSQVNYQNTLQFKEDSVLESTFYTTTSVIVLRVPVGKLDTLVRKITAMALFVDYRKLSANDVKMQLVGNKLAEKRLSSFKQRLEKKSDTRKAQLDHTSAAETALLEKQALADENDLNAYNLVDEVNYSTVRLDLYQAPQEQHQVLPAPRTLKPYEPSFISKTGAAFVNGFELLEKYILFLISSWGFFVVAGFLFFLTRRIVRFTKRRRVN